MKKTILAGLALALALPLSAQMGPGPGGPPPAGGPGGPGGAPAAAPGAAIKDALGMSDSQMQQLQALLQARQQSMEALRTQVDAARKALGDALNATTPDPATVGSALIALTKLEKQGKTIGDTFKAGFDALLTADQKAKVEGWEAVGAALRGLDALKSIGY